MKARENPFRSECLNGLAYRPQTLDWEEIEARLQVLGGRGAIVGPHGSGKSTLLRELGQRLEGRGLAARRLFLSSVTARAGLRRVHLFNRSLGPADALLVDGAEQLPLVTWHALRHSARRAGAFVITCHAPGRLPTLLHTKTSLSLLSELTSSLAAPTDAALLERLYGEHAGNLRDALLSLYDHHAGL